MSTMTFKVEYITMLLFCISFRHYIFAFRTNCNFFTRIIVIDCYIFSDIFIIISPIINIVIRVSFFFVPVVFIALFII